MFPTYGDTDEPAVTEQMNEAHARMDQLSARCAIMERFIAQLLSYIPPKYCVNEADIRDFIERNPPSVSGGEHHPDDEAEFRAILRDKDPRTIEDRPCPTCGKIGGFLPIADGAYWPDQCIPCSQNPTHRRRDHTEGEGA